MKNLILAFGLLSSVSAFACIDISGKYLLNDMITLKYEQTECDLLTEKWCGNADCTAGSSYTWKMDGTINQSGGNPSNWGSVTIAIQSIRRSHFWDVGMSYQGSLCYWKDMDFAKDQSGNLDVTYSVECHGHDGGITPVHEKWIRIQ